MNDEKNKDSEARFLQHEVYLDKLNKVIANQQIMIKKMQQEIADLKAAEVESKAMAKSLTSDVLLITRFVFKKTDDTTT
ncbi:MAG: hypothetical protein Q7U04_07475 [Bacteriovorax sp.]|nr:hypothetical protein [Bacteriovorax sp.]